MNLQTLLVSALTWTLVVGFIPSTVAADAPAATPRFAAQLLWGTNAQKPEGKDFKAIDPELKKRLRHVFKWQNYYEINRKEFATSPGKTARVQMSRECRLEVGNLGGAEFEIRLFGKGVLVVTKRQSIQPGETVVLGGDDKYDDAWFVILGLLPAGAARK